MHEFAFGVTTINPHFGTARNPWNPDYISGGSSGGSASAVALALGFGLGSDTGGSIRIPASVCGIVGLKPTYGRCSLHGVVPLSWSLDHPGPMAQTVEDVAIMLSVIAGHDPLDPYSRNRPVPAYVSALTGNIKGLRIGIPKSYFFEELDGEVDAAMKSAMQSERRFGRHPNRCDQHLSIGGPALSRSRPRDPGRSRTSLMAERGRRRRSPALPRRISTAERRRRARSAH